MIACRAYVCALSRERRFIGTVLTDPPSDGLLDAPRSAWAYAHLADAPEMPWSNDSRRRQPSHAAWPRR